MSLQGPIIVVAENPVPDLIDPLVAAGAFPIVEACAGELAAAITSVRPAAVILADEPSTLDPAGVGTLAAVGASAHGSVIPVIARVRDGATFALGHALPVPAGAGPLRLIARLRAALRVRMLHGSVLRRAQVLREQGIAVPELPPGDPLEDATVLVAGRGPAYPALTAAVGARVGLIGALSLETATNLLGARDIDGIVIGDGFNRRMLEAFLAELGNDARFRDLPIAVLDDIVGEVDPERLPNLDRVAGDAIQIAAHIAPLVCQHAFACRLRRMMASLDGKGVIDPETGLRNRDAFMRDLVRAVGDAGDRGVGLSLARFSLDNLADRRASTDAARIVGRLVRHVDFACRDADGTILVAFTETDLRTAHVIARRIASVLRHTTLAPSHDRSRLDPTIAIAALNGRDAAAALIARVTPDSMVAAI